MTKDIQIVINKAAKTAEKFERPYIDMDVLFDGLLCSNSLALNSILAHLNLNALEIITESKKVLYDKKKSPKPSTRLNKEVREFIDYAENLAAGLETELDYVTLFLAFFHWGKVKLLKQMDIDADLVETTVVSFLNDDLNGDFMFGGESENTRELEEFLEDFAALKSGTIELAPDSDDEILSQFGENLNKKALDGAFNNLIEFNNVLEELGTVMCRQKKPNAILVGPAGGGKTSNVELLAKQIVTGEAPELLSGKVIYTLNLAEMVAGTKYRGEFEGRLKDYAKRAMQCENLILFIDEIHTLVGAGGSTESDLDASNILKPALARGEISCIGATTLSEYNKTIRNDSALDRRFERIVVRPPSSHKMKEIIPEIVGFYEVYHNVLYEDSFVEGIIPMCEKYMPNRFYPDKAIDVIDHCGAMAKVEFWKKNPETNNLIQELNQMNEDSPEYEEGRKELEKMLDEWGDRILSDEKAPVDKKILRDFFNKKGNFLSQVGVSNKLRTHLELKVFGQKRAIDTFVDSINDSSYGLQPMNPNKSPFVFCFYGKKGSGRSHFCSEVADFVRREGGEVLEYNGVEFDHFSKMISDHPDGNSLAQKVSISGNCVIIIDDFHKINLSECSSIFRQIFKEGKVRLSNGEVADFSNVRFIISAPAMETSSLGFAKNNDSNKPVLNEDLSEFIAYQIKMEEPSVESLTQIAANSLKRIARNLDEKGFAYPMPIGLPTELAKRAIKEKNCIKKLEEAINEEVCDDIRKKIKHRI